MTHIDPPWKPSPRLRVLVTGTHRGIGRALADTFARAGAAMVVHARSDDHVASVAADARAAGAADTVAASGDLRDGALPARLRAAVTELGGLDLLILNAGMLGPMTSIDTLEPDDLRLVLEVNVVAQAAIVRALLPALREASGAVIWLTSGLGRFGLPDYGAYCASKHAVEGLMKVVAEENGEHGVVSVAVAPGMVQTDMLRAALRTEDVSEHQSPTETAQAFLRLARALGPEHNGQSLDIEAWLHPTGDHPTGIQAVTPESSGA